MSGTKPANAAKAQCPGQVPFGQAGASPAANPRYRTLNSFESLQIARGLTRLCFLPRIVKRLPSIKQHQFCWQKVSFSADYGCLRCKAIAILFLWQFFHFRKNLI